MRKTVSFRANAAAIIALTIASLIAPSMAPLDLVLEDGLAGLGPVAHELIKPLVG